MLTDIVLTGKSQITLPAHIVRQLGLQRGDRLVVDTHNDVIILKKAQKALDSIVGSLTLPSKYKKKSMDYIIETSKREYFAKRK